MKDQRGSGSFTQDPTRLKEEDLASIDPKELDDPPEVSSKVKIVCGPCKDDNLG